MRLKTPSFWYGPPTARNHILAAGLLPASFIFQAGHALNQIFTRPHDCGIPVICLGNFVAGGGGKTPAALAVMKIIADRKLAAHSFFLSRGFGGRLTGPTLVDEKIHSAADTGDEPLLLARAAPVIVSADRPAGASMARQQGADLIVMDDGMQNLSLKKSLTFAVIDGAAGFGNGRLLPAGPLRESVRAGLAKADAFILVGNDAHGLSDVLTDKPLFRAHLAVEENAPDNGTPYVAFCGLGRPEKFRDTLAQAGFMLRGWQTFPDHYRYTADDLQVLDMEAAEKNARLITTEKDALRLPRRFPWRSGVPAILPVRLEFDDPRAIGDLLAKTIGKS